MGDINISSPQSVSTPQTPFDHEKVINEVQEDLMDNNPSIFTSQAKFDKFCDDYVYAELSASDAYFSSDSNDDGVLSADEYKKSDHYWGSALMNRDENGDIIDTSFADLIRNAYNYFIKGISTIDHFDDNGKLSERISTDKDGFQEYRAYDSQGRVTIYNKSDKDGNRIQRFEYKYNEDGSVETTEFNGDNE